MCCALALPGAALAQQWTVQSGARTQAEFNSNPGMNPTPGTSLTTRSLAANFAAARSTETSESRLEADLSHAPGGGGPGSRGGLALRQRVNTPRQSWTGSASVQRDAPKATPRAASDLLIGAASRTTSDVSLGWTYTLDERWSAQLSGSRSATRLGAGAAAGGDFGAWSASTGLNFAWSETSSLGLSLGRSVQRPVLGDGGSTVDTLRLSGSQNVSETGSLSLNLGRSQATRRFAVASLVCPLPIALCQAGLAPFVVALAAQEQRSHDLQFGASISQRWNEVASLNLNLSRAHKPGVLGLMREDTLGLAFSTRWSDYSSGSLTYDGSRSRTVATGVATTATLRTLGLSMSHRLTERLSLNAQLQQRRFSLASPQTGVTAKLFSISLQYQGDTVPGWPGWPRLP